MGTMRERQREVQLYRGQIPSPGRPTVAWRQDRVRFWAAIADGDKTEDAAAQAGVSSPVGFRWFRHAGGVNPCLSPTVSGRYLSFAEREDIALFRAQGLGVREIARRLDRRRSRGSFAATRRRERSGSSTRRRLRSGTQSGALVVRGQRSSPAMNGFAAMWLSGSRARFGRPAVAPWGLRARSGRAATSLIVVIAAGCRAGVPSRSRIA